MQIVFFSIFSILGIILILGFIMKKKYSISSETTINRSTSDVFNYVKELKNQENYSKWVMEDPNVKLEYSGIDGTIGFISKWESKMKNVGVGEQEITLIKENDYYEVEIRFEKPFKGVSRAKTTTELISENQTKVTTTFYTKTPFPMNIMVPFISKMLKQDMDGNMARLKTILES